jgi:hypothetical protein
MAGEDGGGCRGSGGSGGDEDGLRIFGGEGAARLCGVGLGRPCRRGGDGLVAVAYVDRKASKAASPPLMVRMCVGPYGKGANWT